MYISFYEGSVYDRSFEEFLVICATMRVHNTNTVYEQFY
jgi:hypothetical protein